MCMFFVSGIKIIRRNNHMWTRLGRRSRTMRRTRPTLIRRYSWNVSTYIQFFFCLLCHNLSFDFLRRAQAQRRLRPMMMMALTSQSLKLKMTMVAATRYRKIIAILWMICVFSANDICLFSGSNGYYSI